MFGCAIFLDIYNEYDKKLIFLIALTNLNTMNSNKILQVCTVFFANKNLDEEVLGLFEGKSKRLCYIFIRSPPFDFQVRKDKLP